LEGIKHKGVGQMKVTMTFIDPKKLIRINEIQKAKYEFYHRDKVLPEKIKPFQSIN